MLSRQEELYEFQQFSTRQKVASGRNERKKSRERAYVHGRSWLHFLHPAVSIIIVMTFDINDLRGMNAFVYTFA